MRALPPLALVLLVTTGCARSGTPTSGRDAPPPPAAVPPRAEQGRPEPRPAAHEGRSAPEWAARLKDRNPHTRQQASLALGELREEGFAHLLQGLRSPSPDLRLSCLKAIHPTVLVAHRDEMMPLLLQMVRDADPMVRQNAAIRLSWFQKNGQSALAVLDGLSQNDPDPEVRRVAAQSARQIREMLSGKMSSGG